MPHCFLFNIFVRYFRVSYIKIVLQFWAAAVSSLFEERHPNTNVKVSNVGTLNVCLQILCITETHVKDESKTTITVNHEKKR